MAEMRLAPTERGIYSFFAQEDPYFSLLAFSISARNRVRTHGNAKAFRFVQRLFLRCAPSSAGSWDECAITRQLAHCRGVARTRCLIPTSVDGRFQPVAGLRMWTCWLA